MKKQFFYFLLILFCFSCGSKAKFSGEINIHFNDHQKNKATNKQIIETRLEKLNISKFKIEELFDGFLIKLPRVSDTLLVIQILQSNDRLGFWETYENKEVYPWLEKLDNQLASEMHKDTNEDSTETLHPLFYRLHFNYYKDDGDNMYLSPGSIIGFANEKDIDHVDSLMKIGYNKTMFPGKMILMWGQPIEEGIIPLCALKEDEFTTGPFMDNKEIEYTELREGRSKDAPILFLKLTEEGGRIFESFTLKNMGHEIAINYGSNVIMHPMVESEIKTGMVSISGPSGKYIKFLNYILKMPLYPTRPISISHHFELRK